MRGEQNFETNQLNRAELESKQRQEALKDLYRQSYATTRMASPGNTRGLEALSPGYQQGLSAMEQEGLKRLAAPVAYGTNQMNPLAPFKPSPQSGIEKVGKYASPALTLGGMALDYYRNR